jgi:hypothetical protein
MAPVAQHDYLYTPTQNVSFYGGLLIVTLFIVPRMNSELLITVQYIQYLLHIT